MAQVIPLTSDGSASVTVSTAAGVYNFLTRWNSLDNVWTLDIISPDNVPLVSGMALVPGTPNLLKGLGDLFDGYKLEVYSSAGTENRTTDSLGTSSQVVLFGIGEDNFSTWPDAFSQYPPDSFSVIDPNITFIFLNVLPSTVTLPPLGGSATVSVSCTAPWTATSDNAAITFSPMSSGGGRTDVMTISAPNNETGDITATITIVSGYRTETVTVSQAAYVDAVAISPTSYEFPAAGGSNNFSLTANSSWTASANDPFAVSPASGTGDGTLYVTAPENATGSTINGTLTVVCGTATATTALSQDSIPVDCMPSLEGETWTPYDVCYDRKTFIQGLYSAGRLLYVSVDSQYLSWVVAEQSWYFEDPDTHEQILVTGVTCGACAE